ncbi:MAG: envelope stress response membrane protein PspC [Sphingomonadaceae bacterium]
MTVPSRTKFYRDKHNAKWCGVAAGLADYAGIDVTLVRIGFIILTLATGGWPLLAYFLVAWVTPVKPIELYERTPEDARFWQQVRTNPKRSTREVRSSLRDIDRRLADVETFVTSSNHRLAREIEELR